MPNFRTIKIFWTESIKWYNRKIEPFSFEYPKKSHLKSSYPKRLVPKCSYLKASWKWKLKNPEKSFDCCFHLKSRVPPPPHPPGSACKIKIIKIPQNLLSRISMHIQVLCLQSSTFLNFRIILIFPFSILLFTRYKIFTLYIVR